MSGDHEELPVLRTDGPHGVSEGGDRAELPVYDGWLARSEQMRAA